MQKWKVAGGTTEDGMTCFAVIEAPCEGVAIEHYLATHGLLSYNKMTCTKTDEPVLNAYDKWDSVVKINPQASIEHEQSGLNRHHKWIEKYFGVVAYNQTVANEQIHEEPDFGGTR